MKKLLLSIVTLVAAVTLWAVPAYRGWQTKTQPDGSTIEVRQVGDEFYHYWETRDGKQVEQNAEGKWESVGEAPSAEEVQALRAKAAQHRQRKVVGTEPNLAPRGVVILANFADSEMESSHTLSVFNELCNSENCTVNKYNGINYGSAAQYFADQSNGAYRPIFDVFGPVTLSHKTAYYGGNFEYTYEGKKYSEDSLATDAVIEACILANQQYSSLNFANYDSDGDGYVDFVYVIYAGKGEADPGSTKLPNTIWPHNYSIQEVIEGVDKYFNVFSHYKKANTYVDGKYLDNYACSSELAGSGSMSGIGTLCHEFGHVMGLPDLYDTEYGDNYENGVTPGDWNIMDGGSYNGGGHCPPNYDPWEKYFFGWEIPENLGATGQNITLYANGTSNYQSYQINSANTLQAATKEGLNYYIENRQKSGWDSYVPTSGMLVWKVNFNSSVWKSNSPNNTSGSPRYTIVPADGKTKNYGASGDTYPTSSIRSSTPISGHEITDITKSGNNITFKYNGGEVNYWTYSLSGENCTVPSDGTVDKGAALNLTITPDNGYTLADADCWAVYMGNNELSYGTGFTYTESTGAFSIASVTGNVEIMAIANEVPVTITWMDKGETFTTTQTSAGKLVLPENEPEACDGKVFVGWTATANYSSEDTAPTFVKSGDEATATTYYAVFATEGEGAVAKHIYLDADSVSSSYGTDTEVTRCGVTCYYTNVMKSSGSQIQMKKNGSYIANKTELSKIDSIIIDGTTSLTVYAGTSAKPSSTSITRNGKKYDLSGGEYSYFKIINNTSNAVYADEISIYYSAGGAAYSDYTTTCVQPTKYTITIIDAENGSLNTDPADEAAAGKKVTITATPDTHYHLATLSVKDAEDGDVEVSGEGNERTFIMPEKAVTISATFAADDQYTVRFFNNGIELSSVQYYAGETAEKPTDPTPACEDYTFVGWWTAELAADNTSAKTWITNFTVSAAQDYYAIFSKTETSAGGSYDVTLDPTKDKTFPKDGITLTVSDGSLTNGTDYRVYKGESLTITSSVGNMSNIALTYQSSSYDGGGWNTSYQPNAASWTSPTATSGKNGEQARITMIVITIGSGSSSTTYYTSTVSCGTTGVEETNINAKAVKILRNGQIFILREGRTYTLTGNLVK